MPSPDLPAPAVAEELAVAPAPSEPQAMAVDRPPSEPRAALPRPEERRAQRAARRHRRHLAIGCAVLVAFCLAITILIVVMAGNRTPGPQVVTSLSPASASPAAPLDPDTHPGATALARGRA